MSDFWQRARKLNTIELTNQDPLLSEFKHHFVLLRVHLPKKQTIEQFAQRIPQGFGLQDSLSHSVYIAQIIDKYEGDLFDIAVGFRRDEAAIQIARGTLRFGCEGRVYMVELTMGFRIFMDELRQAEDENNQEYGRGGAEKKPDILGRLQPKQGSENGRSKRDDQSRNKSRSRSRSREKRKNEQKSSNNRQSQHHLKRHKSSKY